MTSQLFSLGRFFLLEYVYSDPVNPQEIDSNDTGFRKIYNGHKGWNTLVNDNNALQKTGNVIDTTVVQLPNNKFVILDRDTAFYYPNSDDDVDVLDVTISPELQVEYDIVRVHILSGYNFPDNQGFIVGLDWRMNNDKPVKILNQAFLKSNTKSIIFNPRPLRTSAFIYDRYIEFKVPSQRAALTQQNNNPGSSTTLSHYFTEGKGLADQNTIYADFRFINGITYDNGFPYLTTENHERFAFSSIDDFGNLVPVIEPDENSDAFLTYATWNGQSMEDFMYQLNSLSGNDFILIHDIRIIEQIGQSFQETDNQTRIQVNNYGLPRKIMPVLEHADKAVSFSIEYTLRLFNRADGRSIFKTASLTSMDVQKYNGYRTQLNVGLNNNRHKIYNKIVEANKIEIKDHFSKIIKTKYIPLYIDTTDIRIDTEDTDFDTAVSRNNVQIKMHPFDNTYKFNIIKADREGTIDTVDLGSVNYFFVFLNDDDSKMKLEETKNIKNGHQNGEILIKVPQANATKIMEQESNRFYVTAVNEDGEETVLFNGTIDKTSKV